MFVWPREMTKGLSEKQVLELCLHSGDEQNSAMMETLSISPSAHSGHHGTLLHPHHPTWYLAGIGPMKCAETEERRFQFH